ncbi:MAG TPA: hypothetical protein QGF95_05530 [Candidatus Latescibacteria bacterium]|jgi:hypothetical protein|nr:hypothetical protein [Gemmatimonadaceae bacterium]HJP29998.1 hypothetical protein [Candidatus Latescibacterota bacterium]
MRRFIALTLFGGLAALAGHAVISLGLHPERLAPAVVLLQGCAALVVGSALFATGMLGLADGFEKLTGRVGELLGQKEVSRAADGIVVSDHSGLAQIDQQFWRGYGRAGIGLGVFMTGLLGLTAALARTSPSLFTVGVGAGITVLFILSATLSAKGLRHVRSVHVDVDASARHLSRLPERRPVEVHRPRKRRTPRVALFPRQGTTDRRRGLDRKAGPNPPRRALESTG